MTNVDTDLERAMCADCGEAIQRYGKDGLWFSSKLGGNYSCSNGGLHEAADESVTLNFPGFSPIKGVGPVITEVRPDGR